MRLTRSWIVDGKFHDFYADLRTSAQYHEKKGKDLGLLRTNLVLQTDNPAGRGQWHGKAQVAAHDWADHLGTLASNTADDFDAIGPILTQLAGDIEAHCGNIQHAVADIEGKDGAAPFVVTEDLTVTDPNRAVALENAADPEQMRQTRDRDMHNAQATIDENKATLQTQVNAAAAALQSTAAHAQTDVPAKDLINQRIKRGVADGSIPAPTDPTQMHDIWEQLTPAEKDHLYDVNHNIGNYGGIPFRDVDGRGRDAFNRRHLSEILANPNLSAADREKYRNVENTINQQQPPRLLGYLDEQGHAAVSINNPDNAKRDVTFVPGTFSDLNEMPRYDGVSMNLYREAIAQSHGRLGAGDVSVTTWIGYDAPQSLFPQAADPTYARNAAGALDSWQNGIRASHNGEPSYNTVIGHSYGTAVVGAAATGGHHLDADAVVSLGSPGMFADSAAGLSLNPSAKVFAAEATFDPIHIADTHFGKNPATWGDAFRFETNPGSPWHNPSDNHGEYWLRDSIGLQNLGRIIDGQDQNSGVTPAH